MPTGIYERTEEHKQAISRVRLGHTVSIETRKRIGLANRGIWVKYKCDYCGKENEEKQSHYNKSKRHFCSTGCYSAYRHEIMSPEEHNAWRGGSRETYKRYCNKNPERIAHLKARRYAREKGAEGSHTFEEWLELQAKHNHQCVLCSKRKKLTKDHIIPLSEGGTDYITNIQPLCRNCNSQKWKHNPELLKK